MSTPRHIRVTLSNGKRFTVQVPSGQDYVIVKANGDDRIKVFLDGRVESIKESKAGKNRLHTGKVLPEPTDGRPQYNDSDNRGRIPGEVQGGAVELGK